MNIEKASDLGFCSGVRRAIRLLEKAAKEHGKVETLGDVVHNRQVMEHLSLIGVTTISDLHEASCTTIAIPSHGATQQTIEELQRGDFRIIDTTCPRVQKAQNIAENWAKSGFEVVVFGDAQHAEVKSVLSHAEGISIAVQDEDMFTGMGKPPRRIGILSQTTQNPDQFTNFSTRITSSILHRVEELHIVNTICDATRNHQRAALDLAKKVDLMLVIGGHDSANTQRLAEVCASTGVETHHIEAAHEIRQTWLQVECIGITAGASTPDHAIDEVVLILQERAYT